MAGFKALERNLAELSSLAARRTVGRNALKAGAKPIIDKAKQLVPVKTGKLKASIGVKPKLSPRQKGLHRKESPVEMFVGPGGKGAKHANLLEFGTVKQAAQPFMRPAWDQTQNQVLKAVGGAMGAQIEKAAKCQSRRLAKLAKK